MSALTKLFNYLIAICIIVAALFLAWFLAVIFFRGYTAAGALSYVLSRLAAAWQALCAAVRGLFGGIGS